MIDETRRRYLSALVAGSGLALAGCLSGRDRPPQQGAATTLPGADEQEREKIDDWQYEPDSDAGPTYWQPVLPELSQRRRYLEVSATTSGTAFQAESVDAANADESIGLAVGGAADVGTFRRNVYEGYLPIPETMAYEGLFHDYYFDTGGDGSCGQWFCPTYTPAVTDDPLSGETERYLGVGLESGLSKADFERPPLNLVIVLDISGSMGAAFDEYYYDRFGNRQQAEDYTGRPKIAVATDVLADLTEHHRPEDNLGVVLFNHDSTVAKPLNPVEEVDMAAIRDHIRTDVAAGGGTNISAGMQDAETLLDDVAEEGDEYENRMILLTDAQVNLGETDADELRSNLEDRAAKEMHTSVIGVGVDFNADLVDQITAVRGSNYYSVYSADQFEQRLVEEFEYMVTPLVYDLSLELHADGYDITQVYGSTAAEEATGELMHVNTLFPSPAEDGKAKGGIVLVQVEATGSSDAHLELEASWERRDGRTQTVSESISFPQGGAVWGSDAIRKAVLLARHADLLKEWTVSERDPEIVREAYDRPDDRDEPTEEPPTDPPLPPGIEPPVVSLGQWELQSAPLTLSAENEQRIREFRQHLAAEADAIGDETLEQELELLDEILAAA